MAIKSLFMSLLLTLHLYSGSGIKGQKAPSFGEITWLQTNGNDYPKIEDYRGKVLYLYGFQSWCPGCHSHGFPTLRKLSKHYQGDDKVAFLAIQTVFEGFNTNTIEAAKAIIERYALTMPVGHSGGEGQRSELMNNYRTGGTPWAIIIDKQGIVRFNGFGVNVEKAIPFIDFLKDEKYSIY